MGRRETDDEAVIAAPFGRVRLRLRAGRLFDVELLSARIPLRKPRTAAARRAARALVRYLVDPRVTLSAPTVRDGTAFQRRVWRELRRIPSGKVLTYGALARRLQTSARAVGGACRANPVALFVPCHRVVAATGQGGFMGQRRGAPFAIKRWLLEHEHAR